MSPSGTLSNYKHIIKGEHIVVFVIQVVVRLITTCVRIRSLNKRSAEVSAAYYIQYRISIVNSIMLFPAKVLPDNYPR